jgi:hypothetical protein
MTRSSWSPGASFDRDLEAEPAVEAITEPEGILVPRRCRSGDSICGCVGTRDCAGTACRCHS